MDQQQLVINRKERRRAVALRRVAEDASGDPLFDSLMTREYCGDVSAMTLWRWAREHGFPPPDVSIGRRNYWRRSTLDRWLQSKQRKAS
jgi:predicted DNA-binding transcriptional regulator AlpA